VISRFNKNRIAHNFIVQSTDKIATGHKETIQINETEIHKTDESSIQE